MKVILKLRGKIKKKKEVDYGWYELFEGLLNAFNKEKEFVRNSERQEVLSKIINDINENMKGDIEMSFESMLNDNYGEILNLIKKNRNLILNKINVLKFSNNDLIVERMENIYKKLNQLENDVYSLIKMI